MSCIQATVYKPRVGLVVKRPLLKLPRTYTSLSSPKNSLCSYASRSQKLLQHQVCLRLSLSASNHIRLAPIYASSGNQNESFSMESLNKAMAEMKREKSIQEMLKEQMTKIGKDGGYKSPPRGGGGGGRGRGGGGSSSEGDSFEDKWNEALQVFLAATSLILVYIYIIRGEELSRLFRDYMTYKTTGRCSLRLERAMAKWAKFWRPFMKSVVPIQRLLETVIARTQTWLHDPEDKQMLHKLLQSSAARRRGAEDA